VRLASLACERVRGVPDGSFAFVDGRTGAPRDVVIITGAPSSGKTSLLEAIAAVKEASGPYGLLPDARRLLRHGATTGRIEATWMLSDAERESAGAVDARVVTAWDLGGTGRPAMDPAVRRLFSAYSRDPACGKVEYFPDNRRLAESATSRAAPPMNDVAEARPRLTRDPDKYAGILMALRALTAHDAGRARQLVVAQGIALRRSIPDSLAPFKAAVAALIPALRLEDAEPGERGTVRFARRDGARMNLADLSASEHQAVLFALAFRHFGLDRSMVLIDEPELHVHTAERVRFLQALVTLGHDNQVIVATGSAEILAAASPGQVIDLSRPAPAALRVAG
jgi:energy-coupling factor transporter ATP-binding protein EcfA2